MYSVLCIMSHLSLTRILGGITITGFTWRNENFSKLIGVPKTTWSFKWQRKDSNLDFLTHTVFFFFLSFFFFFGGGGGQWHHICSIWNFPGSGSNWSCSHRPTPQPQQCQIRAMSVIAGSMQRWILNALSKARD